MAKKFVFSLQAVLDQRERGEREQQLRVGALERERVEIEERIKGYQERIVEAKKDLRAEIAGVAEKAAAVGSGRVRIDAVRLQSAASLHLVSRAHAAVLELAGVHRRLDGARAELARAAAARKAVSRLREKQYEEWKREIAKQEAADVDELAVVRHKRTVSA